MDRLNYEQVREMLLTCAENIIRNEPYLTKVDSAIGDGDHGIGMRGGMQAAKKVLEAAGNVTADQNAAAGNGEILGGAAGSAETAGKAEKSTQGDIYRLYADMAQAMEDAMGGASGMIFSTLFAGDAKEKLAGEIARKTELTAAELADQMAAGLRAIQAIGHAEVGDKTMVDALAPAALAMQSYEGSDIGEMLTLAAEAARGGMEDTKNMTARFGRAKSLMERAVGFQDAGATSTWLILRQMADYVNGTKSADPDPAELPKPGGESEAAAVTSKKIINDPADCVKEEAEGFLAAFGADIEAVPGVNGLIRKEIPKGKTALVIGGGSGHEPMFGFFLGENLADAAANGNVFASPDPHTIQTVAEAADRGAGVLFVYGNYAGDNLNFDAAAERLLEQGVESRTVRVKDDIASAPRDRYDDRRGIAGDVPVVKVAGAACAKLSLEEAYRVTAKARDNTYTIGVALQGASIPGQKEPIFTLPSDEIEYGLGIHGEPGVRRIALEPADTIVTNLVNEILKDSGITEGDEVITYINGLGSTTLMELMIMNRKLALILKEKGIRVHDMDVGSYVTTMEMAGASITLMKLDEELKEYYDQPCRSPFYKK